jgi:predicted transcriptional regulator
MLIAACAISMHAVNVVAITRCTYAIHIAVSLSMPRSDTVTSIHSANNPARSTVFALWIASDGGVAVKTTTIRLGDDLMELVEEVAASKKRSASEILRAAIRDYMQKLASEDDEVRKARDRIADRRITAQTNATRHELGMEPVEVPSEDEI